MKVLKLGILMILLIVMNTVAKANLSAVEIPLEQEQVTKKLTFKERVATKFLQKKVQKQQKKALQKPAKKQKTKGFLGRLFLGVGAMIIGALVFVLATISLSLWTMLFGIALMVIGVLLMISSIFNII